MPITQSYNRAVSRTIPLAGTHVTCKMTKSLQFLVIFCSSCPFLFFSFLGWALCVSRSYFSSDQC